MDQCDKQIEQIASYLDDELDGQALVSFEAHIDECSRCSEELQEQRGLLGTLNVALQQPSQLPLPKDFARIVAAHAESDMSGVRASSEHRRAFGLCAILAMASIALLGVAARTYMLSITRKFVRPIAIVLDLVWTTVYDAVSGLLVISRVISKSFVPSSHWDILLGLVLLILAVLLLSRSISNYHSTRFVE